MQVKRPIKFNKFHLKGLEDTYSKNTREAATEKQRTRKQKKKRYKSIRYLFRDSPHPDPAHVTTSQLNFDKIEITGFRKTQDNRPKNLRTDSSNKSQ